MSEKTEPLPPITCGFVDVRFDGDGWFCDKCGERMPANYEAMVKHYSGYREHLELMQRKAEALRRGGQDMSEKPEALRLADRMAEGTGLDTQWDAAKELRRLHAEVERLREALESIAANACCDRCQEAALVAKAALRRED